jgi:hypothetical protein
MGRVGALAGLLLLGFALVVTMAAGAAVMVLPLALL